ncbi:MAG TPA: hypothetical protein VE135_19340 [Pyrinomonadaceae bacterium]|nr:hypothetical protein [Pyrinomonadaceae bacterium]
MKPGIVLRLVIIVVLFVLGAVFVQRGYSTETSRTATQGAACEMPFPLPNPSEIGVSKFDKLLHTFLEKGCYKVWVADSQIRNSGPFIRGESFGTHNAVKIYYSPQVWDWLKHRNRQGAIPDGAMIVKEMYPSPAKEGLKLSGWTTMVKDKKGSFDGWFWSYHAPGYAPASPGIDYPDSGFGLYCLRCHASAEKESTFITLKNVEGDPISFLVQAPTMLPQPPPTKDFHEQVASVKQIIGGPFPLARKSPDQDLLNLLKELPVVQERDVKRFPGESFDHVTTGSAGPEGFLTSSQCIGCHSASNENMGFRFQGDAKPTNLSPYTEWHASMMGLAGRDPIFHAQLESEKTLYPSQAGFLDDTCYRCHGVMGQRQLALDKNQPFKHGMVYALPDELDGKYGALARDGVSCASCHRVAQDGLGRPESFTGKFKLDAPNVVNGPYDQVATLPMKQALNITPRYGKQIKSSALCGSCHTVALPIFNREGKPVRDASGKPKEFHEQTTYPEWLNSIYQNEREPFDLKTARTCQDCHMPSKFLDRPLVFRIANIEDNTYPYTDYRAPDKEITLRVREQYSRHTLVGINEFGMMMFQQFPNILGVRTADYMYAEGVLGLLTALSSSDSLARNETAGIAVTSLRRTDDSLEATVHVENLAGHSFPSGVAFRRAFIALEVFDAAGKVVWASGRTNKVGAIVNGTSDEVLSTEFFYDTVTRKQVFQPHYDVITQENQVQIYEELLADSSGKTTTSFVGLDHPLKNNRLLPKGWQASGPFANLTGPHGDAERDPEYVNKAGSSGADTIIYRVPLNDRTRGAVAVMAVLYYQSIPPYYLKERFSIGKGPETKRLAYITSRLTVEGTPLENWKLSLVCATRAIGDTASLACQR